ncbi:MAG: alkaline phosphatase family protein [Chloroflexi bacterium]|nr:alkaline phosphatase family protein [Chloroflexota bacterium]
MSEEIKKVLVVALEGASSSEIYEPARAGKLPNVGRLLRSGSAVPKVAVAATAAASWATLATGAHTATHGVVADEPCRAQYIWQAAEKTSKRGLLLGFPASAMPEYHEDHPVELVNPESCDAAYFDRVASHLLCSPDWDLAFVRVPTACGLAEADEFVGKVLDAADLETLRVFVAAPNGEGDGLVVLEGPGVKRGHVVSRPAELADVAPTLCYLAETPMPADCEGGIIYQALEEPDAKILELQTYRRNYERLRRSSGATPMC